MNDVDYITNYWHYADTQEDNLLGYIGDKQSDLSDELQGILDHFKSIQLSGNIGKSEVERLHRKIGQWQKAGYDVGEFKLIMRDLDNRTRIKGTEALLAFLLAAFIGNHKAIVEQDKVILQNITQEAYRREFDNARKITGKGTAKTPTQGDLNAILNGSIVTGGNFYDDMYADARYRADQFRKIINADMQQKKPLDIDNVQYQRALKAQKDWMLRRSQHGANKDNHAGQLDIYMSFAISETVVRAFRDAGVKKYQFIATIDNVTTDACRSLHLKIFDLDKIMIGINAPPVYPPFHYCRSIIRAVE